jgi:hypothetical protein
MLATYNNDRGGLQDDTSYVWHNSFFHAWAACQAIQIMCTILTLTMSVINGWKKNRRSCKHQQFCECHICIGKILY